MILEAKVAGYTKRPKRVEKPESMANLKVKIAE